MPTLSYFKESDFEQLIGWINTEELLVNWSGRMFSFPLTTDSLNWYLSNTNDIQNSDAFIFKALDDDGKMVGHISLGGISTTNKSARISRVFVSNEGRNKGICTFMAKAVAEFGFKQLQLHRIALGVYDTNQSAVQCYTKAGFKVEGTHRDVLLYNNQYWSMVEMAILYEDWLTQQT
ncbi:MAG: GNAT family protein [Chitinophagaceae bacterium]|jgi:RimJ/RimL family protein N-acetyltransferase|nr:GNAT family N-acetyltransferase [Chitinophagaceae bacterium]